MKFQGMSISGCDNLRKKYFNIGIDNIGTSYFLAEGTCVENLCRYTGTMIDPINKKEYTTKDIFKFIDDDKLVEERYQKDKDGKEFKAMEIIYTRKK